MRWPGHEKRALREAVRQLSDALTVGLDGSGGFDHDPSGWPSSYITDKDAGRAADRALAERDAKLLAETAEAAE